MCGIVGYMGHRKAQDVLMEGLARLEYRGYDSAGLSILEKDGFQTMKAKGRLKNLETLLAQHPLEGHLGIGHTRWATHGEPSNLNAHPHSSENGSVLVVHNGIIENYAALRSELKAGGVHFQSDTDTEVIPNLIAAELSSGQDFLTAVRSAVGRLKGSFALGVVCSSHPEELVALRKDSPLIIGVGEGETFIASDVPAILRFTDQVLYLNDLEFAHITADGLKVFDAEGASVPWTTQKITWSAEQAEKGGYDHYTLKEIYEQPKALRDTMAGRMVPGAAIELGDIAFTKEALQKLQRISIVACGTAYHAGLAGKKALEALTRIPVETEVASEFRYQDPILDENSLVVVISQSGETADTLAVLREAKQKGARVLAITNVVGSSIAREAQDVFYTWAGPEIGVASTKAYLTQLVAMYTLALYFAQTLGTLSEDEIEDYKAALLSLPDQVEETLKLAPLVEEMAKPIAKVSDVYFLGRGMDNVTATEASLKLKELTYIHSESYPGGELKHGPIALIEEGTIVLCPLTQGALLEKMISNLKEVHTRGARIFAITTQAHASVVSPEAETLLVVPDTLDLLTPVLAVVPCQLLAYYVSLAKGFDVDKPRNLAKSVTVE
ncbi:Glucosamine--fructose-6-phosphate aminotransferase, isomerizing [Clostridiaceae bacterium JG1575]|nr:Glucosamine--fructose-6-phosphate aminotransferase, isomerizing [Clostridiaceae bacterium JG1575]